MDGNKLYGNELFGSIKSEKASNQSQIGFLVNRLRNYMMEDDALMEELETLRLSEEIDDSTVIEYREKVENVLNISNVLDNFPISKIESYLRKKKIEQLNQNESGDACVSSSGI